MMEMYGFMMVPVMINLKVEQGIIFYHGCQHYLLMKTGGSFFMGKQAGWKFQHNG